MNKSDFKKEIGEYIERECEKFYSYQEVVTEIYNQLMEISIRRNIPVYVAYGSLLGLIRDSGFLPWDRDIDTFVLYKDIDRLIKALKEELPCGYYLVSNIIDQKYHGLMMRVCKKGYNSDAIHVDVFYAIYCSDNEKKQREQIKQSQKLFEHQFLKHFRIKRNSYSSSKKYLYALVNSCRGKCIPQSIINKNFKRLVSEYTDTNSLLIIAGEATRVLNKQDVVPGKIAEINGMKCYLCENYDSILKKMYGDYSQYMDIEDRFKEFYTGLCYLNEEAKEPVCN